MLNIHPNHDNTITTFQAGVVSSRSRYIAIVELVVSWLAFCSGRRKYSHVLIVKLLTAFPFMYQCTHQCFHFNYHFSKIKLNHATQVQNINHLHYCETCTTCKPEHKRLMGICPIGQSFITKVLLIKERTTYVVQVGIRLLVFPALSHTI